MKIKYKLLAIPVLTLVLILVWVFRNPVGDGVSGTVDEERAIGIVKDAHSVGAFVDGTADEPASAAPELSEPNKSAGTLSDIVASLGGLKIDGNHRANDERMKLVGTCSAYMGTNDKQRIPPKMQAKYDRICAGFSDKLLGMSVNQWLLGAGEANSQAVAYRAIDEALQKSGMAGASDEITRIVSGSDNMREVGAALLYADENNIVPSWLVDARKRAATDGRNFSLQVQVASQILECESGSACAPGGYDLLGACLAFNACSDSITMDEVIRQGVAPLDYQGAILIVQKIKSMNASSRP